jgi:hypothetical protein
MMIRTLSIAAALSVCIVLPLASHVQQAPDKVEKHLRNIRHLTFGGENAEAYFSRDGKRLNFQSTRDGVPCDQIFSMNVNGGDLKRAPPVLKRQLDENDQQQAAQKRFIANQEDEKKRINARFDEEMVRLKVLWSPQAAVAAKAAASKK